MSWGSRQPFFAERAYPGPRASTDSVARHTGGTTPFSYDSGCAEFLGCTTTASNATYSSTDTTPPSTSTPTPAHAEHSSVEFATLLSHDKECINTYHDGEPLRYRTMEDLLGDQPVPGLVPHDLEA